MRKQFERFLRLRFTVPLLIIAALSLSLLSELTYQRTVKVLGEGIELTDARIGSAKILQLLTDAETAQRGYLLTGNPDYRRSLQNAEDEFEADLRIFDYIEGIGTTGRDDAQKIKAEVIKKFTELERTLALAGAGDRAAALAIVVSGEGQRTMDGLRGSFDHKLKEAATLQLQARDMIYTALWVNRTMVVALLWLVALGLYLHLRQLNRLDEERGQRQQLLETQVAERTRDLRTLAGYLQTAREDEKAHLARELHDELGSLLTAAKLTLVRMRAKLSENPEMMARISDINQHLNAGIALKRKVVEDLRPSTLSLLGLNVALANLCSEVAAQRGIQITAEIDEVTLSPDAELGVFRVVQEALTNIAKYANATQVQVRLQAGAEQLQLEVLDNGVGFDVATLKAGRHGLAGMRFRMESLNGTLLITSQPGQGVRLVARLPGQAAPLPAHAA